ncbi:glycosyl transferase [Desulfosarcina alkanivorans]|uniref:Glycosyl transferase n=1 Tax=Desulfosarcina alkanivorans TaxID=571177 RepID=A0A5K7YKI0_9BACT|nr:TIGR03013 family XrtA/PEP-CTERM system glycosyltransferase [Desulfosarcina alkanivorans]BBO67321.1 glycosyl transferase [Desulfosarcina alkanivorans]
MLRLFKQYYPVRNALFVVGEGLFIFLSVIIASWLLIGNEFIVNSQALVLKTLLIASVCQLCLYYNDLYDLNVTNSYQELLIRLLQALGASAIFLALVYFLFPVCIIGRGIFIVSICFVVGFIVIWRIAYTHVLNHGLFDKKIVLLGSGDLAKNIAKEILDKKDCGYRVAAVVNGKEYDGECLVQTPVNICRNDYSDLCKNAKALNIDKIVVAIEERRQGFPIRQLLQCRVDGIEVIEGTSFYEMLTGKLIVEKINPSWLIFSEGFRKSWLRKVLKRTGDLILSFIMLILLAPVLIAVAILIKLDSKGPVFFSQERVGEDRKPYMVHKFRSMVQDAEKKSGPVWAQSNDSRVTRIGKFIRKWRIDEFPQLFNVIKGEMSFVGPRPEREFFVKELEEAIPYYAERFSVKPGVTGWAQVSYPYGASVEDAKEKLNYDLFYIKNMSILMDMMVIMRTVKTVLFGEGAR